MFKFLVVEKVKKNVLKKKEIGSYKNTYKFDTLRFNICQFY